MKKKKNRMLNFVEGTFVGNERGFGFVEVEGRENDIFIPPKSTASAMHGDIVLVKIVEESADDKRAEGRVVEVLKRNTKVIIGTYQRSNKFGFVVPDDRKIFVDIYIPKKHAGKTKNNDKVIVEITKFPTYTGSPEGKIIENLGGMNDSSVDLISVLRTYDYKKEFPKPVQKEANMIPQVVLNADGRKDLRDKEIFTIDGADTKDIDDAISIEKVGDNYLLGVHIADVSHYVQEGSALDKEAAKRGTSVYLLDSVIPMLPKQLSNGICSLNEGVDRNTLSIDILLDKDANVLESKLYKAVINSRKKMTYGDVHKIIELDEVPEGYEPFVDTLKLMKELAVKLIDKRNREGAIEFSIPEAKIILDENDKAVDIVPRQITLANRLIEQFMVLANECVAKTFSEKNIPIIYRIHEMPEADRLDRFKTFLHNLNYVNEIPEEITPKDIQKILEKSKGQPDEKVISLMALRTMQLAIYSNQNLGHFGLALKNYCHFTSPIRRYPDLFTHRVISEYLLAEQSSFQSAIKSSKLSKYTRLAIHYAETSSETEQRSEEAEREINAIKKCEYMKEHIGEVYQGYISGVTSFGMFVELENTIEGLVHVERMDDDYYEYDEINVALIGRLSKKVYKLGDKVSVKVVSADKLTRRVEFEIANF